MSDEHGIQIELVTNRSAVPLAADEWNALVAKNETNTVFQTYEWFDAWWQSFGASRELFFLVLREASVITGFAAMMRTRTPFGWRELQFAGAGNADYQDFVVTTDKPRAIAAICEFLRDCGSRWERLALGNIPSHSSTLPLLTAAAGETGLYLVNEARVICPTLKLKEDPARAREMIKKYSLRRPHNWFSKRGAIGFRHVTSSEEISRLLPAFFDQHRRRWDSVGKPSLFTQALQMRFYETLARTLHGRGWLQFSVVEFDGAPIAFHFGFDYFGCVTWYKPSFEVCYAEHSPGLLLTRELIEDGLQRERVELDFTAGDEAFKGRFASCQRYNVFVGVYHSRIAWKLAIGIRDLRRAAGATLRRVRSWLGHRPAATLSVLTSGEGARAGSISS